MYLLHKWAVRCMLFLSIGILVVLFYRHGTDRSATSTIDIEGLVEKVITLKDQKQEQDDVLPPWVSGGQNTLEKEILKGSNGLTDKTTSHRYQWMYHRYFSQFLRRKVDAAMQGGLWQNIIGGNKIQITMLEIGLGCAQGGGMVRGIPGGSALAWQHLFNHSRIHLELHIMEYDAKCAEKWASEHQNPNLHVHYGDQSKLDDLMRVVKATSKGGFDIIIDDGSHINSHQIFSVENLIPHLLPHGFYVIEDIHSACKQWRANMGTELHHGPGVGGTKDCMGSDESPTIFRKIVEWQKQLLTKPFFQSDSPFHKIDHIDICMEAVVFGKNL